MSHKINDIMIFRN